MTTAPSFSPANPKPKIYLALSHDDFISISPAIFRSDLPPFSCRFLTRHLSCARLHQRFTLTRKARVEIFQAHTSARARSLADRQRCVWWHLLFQLPGLQEGPRCSCLIWEGCGRFVLGGGRFFAGFWSAADLLRTGNIRFPLEEVGNSAGGGGRSPGSV